MSSSDAHAQGVELDALARRLRHLLRYERMQASPARLEPSATVQRLLALGAPVLPALEACWAKVDRAPLPESLTGAIAAVESPSAEGSLHAAGSPRAKSLRAAESSPGAESPRGAESPHVAESPHAAESPRAWTVFAPPILLCDAASRDAVAAWLRRLAYLAFDEGYLASAPMAMTATEAFHRLRHADLRLLVEVGAALPDGQERAALLWLLRLVHGRALAQRGVDVGADDARVLAALREEGAALPFPILEQPAAALVLSDREKRSPELAVLAYALHGARRGRAEVDAALRSKTAFSADVIGRARAELERRGLIAALRTDGGEAAEVTTWDGAVFQALAHEYGWNHGPGELDALSSADLEAMRSQPARLAGALHQKLWHSGPTETIVRQVMERAVDPQVAVRRTLFDGFARRQHPPPAPGSQERPPGGALLGDAEWTELLRRGRADGDAEVRAATERLAEALTGPRTPEAEP